MIKVKKIANISKECVACGTCVPTCPKKALHIHLGIIAKVNPEKCLGCGICAIACPAAVITYSNI